MKTSLNDLLGLTRAPRFTFCFVCTLLTAAMALALMARASWLVA